MVCRLITDGPSTSCEPGAWAAIVSTNLRQLWHSIQHERKGLCAGQNWLHTALIILHED